MQLPLTSQSHATKCLQDPYQAVVSQVTSKFQNLSRLILELQARADSDECRDKTLANLIRKVQMLEEKKLHLTVDLQLALQQAQDHPGDDLVGFFVAILFPINLHMNID
jgi:hypothetical protein